MRQLICLLTCLVMIVASSRAESFKDVKLVRVEDGKSKETDASLHIMEDRLVVRSDKSAEDLITLPYSGIKSASYSYSKHPRWKSGAATAAVVGVFAAPVFMKGKRHWLTVRGEKDFAVLHLDKDNHRKVIPALETKAHLK